MDEYDLVVVGGGPAGVGAALSGAKNNLKTAIVERSSMLGGNWTNGYVLSILGVYTYDGSERIVGGIVDEIVDGLKQLGGTKGKSGNFIPFRPDEMKLNLSHLVDKYKITTYFNSLVVGADVSRNRIESIKLSGKDGTTSIKGKFFVDSSGDADLTYYATANAVEGKEGEGWHQEATLPFRIGNVDEDEIIEFSKSQPDLISVTLDRGRLVRFRIMPPLVEKAKKEHSLYLPDANAEFLFNTSKKGEFVCNATHTKITDFKSGREIANYMNDLRHQVASSVKFLVDNVKGFENAYLIDSAPMIGMRETRRAVGEYVLKKKDVIGNARFDDAIARCGHPLEIHDPNKGVIYVHLNGGDSSWYHIPYRSIVQKGVDNAFVVGRCLSAEFEAQASARVTGTALAMGHAAGAAAALAMRDNRPVKDIDIKELQARLREQGAII
ncbi:MAG: FAD-dependent oxidoreductase [Candidatus Micrarchaeaceae archaeon]